MVNVSLSPSILPSMMVDFPIIWLDVSPVSLLPSTLKTKVRSIGPLGVSAVPFHVPLTSAAEAQTANTIINTSSHLIRSLPFFYRVLELKNLPPRSSPQRTPSTQRKRRESSQRPLCPLR